MQAAELFDISGQVAMVTGGAAGIGREIVRVLAENGARVYACDVDEEKLDELADRFAHLPGTITGCRMDVTDGEAVAALFARIEDEAGPVTILVNNAAVVHRDKAAQLKPETLRSVFSVNLDGAFLVAQAMANRLVAAHAGGTIINVSSILAEMPVRQVIAYGAAKAALSQMTRTMALEWARHDIRVNEIRPGWFDTALTRGFLKGPGRKILAGQTPLGRLGQPGDLDGAVLFLASGASTYVTGTTLTVDGGHLLGP